MLFGFQLLARCTVTSLKEQFLAGEQFPHKGYSKGALPPMHCTAARAPVPAARPSRGQSYLRTGSTLTTLYCVCVHVRFPNRGAKIDPAG